MYKSIDNNDKTCIVCILTTAHNIYKQFVTEHVNLFKDNIYQIKMVSTNNDTIQLSTDTYIYMYSEKLVKELNSL